MLIGLIARSPLKAILFALGLAVGVGIGHAIKAKHHAKNELLINQRNLAKRWDVSEATLERWRTEGIGPKYLKRCGRVLYRLVDIEEYESACLMSSTGKAVAV